MRIQTGNVAHDNTCLQAEVTRQVAVKAAGSNQASATAAEITFYKTVRDSARTNGMPEVGVFNQVIMSLGGSP